MNYRKSKDYKFRTQQIRNYENRLDQSRKHMKHSLSSIIIDIIFNIPGLLLTIFVLYIIVNFVYNNSQF